MIQTREGKDKARSEIFRKNRTFPKKVLDIGAPFAYIIGALRRQQVGLPVNPAEDINKF